MRETGLKYMSFGTIAILTFFMVLLAVIRVCLIGPVVTVRAGDSAVEKGAALFAARGCADCHYTDRRKTKVGPGLQGLFNRATLPVSGKKVSEEHVHRQLTDPYENMPSFADSLSERQREHIISYLKTL